MTKQKSFWSEVGDVLGILWAVFCRVVVAIYAWVQTWKWKTILKTVGMGITVFASLGLAFEVVFGILLLGDPYQVALIVQTLCGINIFSYITEYQYYGFVLGGVIADLTTLTLLLWLGIYLWCKKNYFIKPKKAWLYVAFLWVVGVAMVCTSAFYMLPSVAPLVKEMHKSHHGYGHEYKNTYNNSYQKKENYYETENYMNVRHEDMRKFMDDEAWFITW